MKNILPLLLAGIALSLLISSCSVEKRIYRPGHYVNWKKQNHPADKTKPGSDHDVKEIIARKNDDSIITKDQSETNEKTTESFPATTVNNSFATSPEKTKQTIGDRAIEKKVSVDSKTEKQTLQERIIKNNNIKKGSDSGAGSGLTKAILTLVLAFVLIAIGIVFYTSIGVLGVIFLIIFGVAGVLFFIKGLIMLLKAI